MSDDAALSVLTRSLDQLGDLLVHVSGDRLDARTPCADWTLGDLADHVVAAPAKFTIMARGEQPDWSAAPEHLESGWAPAFRSSADELVHLVGQSEGGSMDPDWMTAEFAVHTWDLAHGLGRSTSDLDPGVAERGLGFMRRQPPGGDARRGVRPGAAGPRVRGRLRRHRGVCRTDRLGLTLSRGRRRARGGGDHRGRHGGLCCGDRVLHALAAQSPSATSLARALT